MAGDLWRLEAFGVDDLGPGAPEGADRWCRAVALGARGRAAAARVELDRLPARSPIVRSLAASTRGSLVRQSGRHADARSDDGLACLLAAGVADRDEWVRAAWLDGLIGLAANALGIGEFAVSDDLLARVGDELDSAATTGVNWVTTPRVRLRHAWVRTEHGLYSGDADASAEWATRAAELAADCPSARHRVKTDLIGAAVDAAHGRLDSAIARAHDVESRCRAGELLPLQWAAATMLAGLDPTCGDAAERASRALAQMSCLGMTFVTGA